MTEDEVRSWIEAHYGAIATDRLAAFVAVVIAENDSQNLIAPSTIGVIWSRHVMDSAQLVPWGRRGLWIDIGTGGGFPGIVVALLCNDPIMLVEPRKRRASFLEHCACTLGLKHVSVVATTIEKVVNRADTISARAVAPVEKLLQIGAGCAKKDTRWLLPRGRVTEAELVDLKMRWDGVFHVKQSVTDPTSSILMLDGVKRR